MVHRRSRPDPFSSLSLRKSKVFTVTCHFHQSWRSAHRSPARRKSGQPCNWGQKICSSMKLPLEVRCLGVVDLTSLLLTQDVFHDGRRHRIESIVVCPEFIAVMVERDCKVQSIRSFYRWKTSPEFGGFVKTLRRNR